MEFIHSVFKIMEGGRGLIQVRLATADDAEELSRLNQRFNGGERRPAEAIAASMGKSGERIAVATLNGSVVGFACAQCFESFCYPDAMGEITELYVEESARGMGAASSLIALLEEHLQASGVREIKVLMAAGNGAALKTYERCGYTLDDDVLLRKKIGRKEESK